MPLSVYLTFLGTIALHGAAARAPVGSRWQRWLRQHPAFSRVAGAALWTAGLTVGVAADGWGVALTVALATTMIGLPLLSLSAPWWPPFNWRAAPFAATGALFFAWLGLL